MMQTTKPASCGGAPACFCETSTPWTERRFDGPWHLDGRIVGYQRTCTKCGASKTIDRAAAPREDELETIRTSDVS